MWMTWLSLRLPLVFTRGAPGGNSTCSLLPAVLVPDHHALRHVDEAGRKVTPESAVGAPCRGDPWGRRPSVAAEVAADTKRARGVAGRHRNGVRL